MWIELLELIELLEEPSVAKKVAITTIQVSPSTRDRLYRLKFRKTYDEFLQDLCDLFEKSGAE